MNAAVHRIYPRVWPGDRLWVRETWGHSEVYGIGTEGRRQTVGERGQLVLKRWYAEQKGWTT